MKFDNFVRFIEFITGIQIPTWKHCIIIAWLVILTPWLILNSLIYKILGFDILYDGQTSLVWLNDDITFYNKRYKRPIIIFYDVLCFTGILFHISFLLWLTN